MSSNENENSNSSNSSSDENDIEQELLGRASELEAQLSENKYLYDLHVEVINVYRKLADLNSLREAYQRFHEYYPLTPKLWLEWIKDEIKIANTKEEQQHVLDLFDKAVDDYLSVDLWVEYAQYSVGLGNLEVTRAILEKGLTSAGLHVSNGFLLWDTLREIENAHISFYKRDSDDWANQVKRVSEVFKRQLSVPLLNMENTYLEWKEWFKTLPNGLIDQEQVEWGYKKALQNLESYKPFEDKLLSAEETEFYDIYKEYIKIIKDPLAIICLYERAVVNLCLNTSLWDDYTTFSFKMKEVALKVTARSLRNCPWSEQLWIMRLRVLENYNRDEKEVVTCFEQGLSNINPSPPLELWFSFLEYYHRKNEDKTKLDKLFSKAMEQVTPKHDPTYKLSRWYARLLAKKGDIVGARKIWTEILADKSFKFSANAWLEFANLERQFGETNQVRNIFKRALTSCKDWAQYISEEWLIFEREIGSLQDVMNCLERCKQVVKNIPQYLQPDTTSEKPRRHQKRKHEIDDDLSFKKLRLSQKNETKKNQDPPSSSTKVIEKDPKTTVFVSNLHPSVTEQHLKDLFPNALNLMIVLDKKGKSRCFGYIQFSKEEEVMTALARDRVPIDGRPVFISELKPEKGERKQDFKYATTLEQNKLFVKGIPVSKSKEEIDNIFKPYNPVDVRLVFKKNGELKGIAYVEFKTKEEARKALELNSKKIDDSELFVAISAPPQKTLDKPEQSEPIRHARSRLQVPMIPRTLQVKNIEKNSCTNESANLSNKGTKSNADFRNMFLQK